jgi:aspartate racemase
MLTVDFAEIEQYQVSGQWQAAGQQLAAAAAGLEQAGADMVLICTNLMHKVAPIVAAQISVPLLHIADAAGRSIRQKALKKVGLLGARYTMEEDFYRRRLYDNFGIEVVIPNVKERERVHRVIFEELCRGKITADARRDYLAIIDELRAQGAEGVILGCTEIPLLIGPADTDLPLFNTTALHAGLALESAFNEAVAVAV